MGVILDTSAVIGLHEVESSRVRLRTVLVSEDDGTAINVHAVSLGELGEGVYRAISTWGLDSGIATARATTLALAQSLECVTIQPPDTAIFGQVSAWLGRRVSHNDKWIVTAAIRNGWTLITQDSDLAERVANTDEHAPARRPRLVLVPR